MRADVKNDDIIKAVVKTITDTFDKSRWLEFGMEIGALSPIRSRHRLLQGAEWRNDDYPGIVIDIVPSLLKLRTDANRIEFPDAPRAYKSFPNLALIERFLRLRAWLEENDPPLCRALYAGTDEVVIDDLQASARRLGVEDVDIHAARIRHGMHEDPVQAVGSAKELLETVFKAVLRLHGNGRETEVKLPQLAHRVNVRLGLDAGGVRGDEPGADQRRRLLGALTNVVSLSGELRNRGFGTGHGGSQRKSLDAATTRLAVSSAAALATFYIEAWEAVSGAAEGDD